MRLLPIANKLPTTCIVLTTLDYIYNSVGTDKCVQNLVLLPDANELPDENTLGTGIQRLTLAEQDCRFRMNDDHPSARVQESTSHTQKSECFCQSRVVRVAFQR